MSFSLSKERRDLHPLHSLSNGTGSDMPDSPSPASHGRTDGIWKNEATIIPPPGTDRRVPPLKTTIKPSPMANPYSRLKNDLNTRNPSSLSLVPIASSYSTTSNGSNRPPASKKRRVNVEGSASGQGAVQPSDAFRSAPSASASSCQEMEQIFSNPSKSNGVHTRKWKKSIPGDLPRETWNPFNVIDLDEDLGEPLVQPTSESSDDLRLRVGERFGRNHAGSTSIQDILESGPPPPDHPFHGKGKSVNHRPPPPGPQTSALKEMIDANMDDSASSNGSESDPIECFDSPPPDAARYKRKATPSGMTDFKVGHVRDTAKHYEGNADVQSPLPEVDLIHKMRKNKISNMKPKKPRPVDSLISGRSDNAQRLDKPRAKHRKLVDSIATSSTGFQRHGRYPESEEEILLPIEKWIYGTRVVDSTKDTPSTRHWLSIQGDHVLIATHAVDRPRRTPLLDLMLGHDIDGVELPRITDNAYDFPCITFHVLKTDRSESLFREQEQSMEDLWIALKVLKKHANWDITVFKRIAEAIESSGCSHSYVDSHARRAQWESLELDKTPADISPASTQPPGRVPKARPAFAGARKSVSSDPLAGQSSASNPWLRRSSRKASNVSQNSGHPPSLADETILLYPPTGTGAVNVTHGDLKRLEPGEYLNDTLIELGLKLWLTELKASKPDFAEQVHVFSSFFYTQLNQKNVEEGYHSVRKWTSRFDLFAKKYIVIPINEHMHWYLAIICYPERSLQQPTPIQPITPNVTTRNRLRESLSNPESRAETKYQSSRLANTKPTSTSPKARATEEQEVESLVNAPYHIKVQANRHPSASPLTMLSPDSDRGGVIFETESEKEDGQITSVMKDAPSPQSATPPTAREFGTVPTSTFYGSSDGKMRSMSEETEGKQEEEGEVDRLEDDNRMEVDDPPSVPEPEKPDSPYIFSFDSLGTRHPHALKLLSLYLELEAKDKKDLPQIIPAITKQASVPTQPNYCDCGVYLLHFVERFMSDPDTFTNWIASHAKSKKPGGVSRQEREDLWNHTAVASKRKNLKQTIISLSSDWKRGREADGKQNVEDDPKKAQVESIAIDNDSDIEVLETTAEPNKVLKGAPSRTPTQHRAQRIR